MKKWIAVLMLCSFVLCLCAGCTTAQVSDPGVSDPPVESPQPEETPAPTEEVELPSRVTIYHREMRPGERVLTRAREIENPGIIATLCDYFTTETPDESDAIIDEEPEFYIDLNNGTAFSVAEGAAYCKAGRMVVTDGGGEPSLLLNTGWSQFALPEGAYAYLQDLMQGWEPEPPEKVTIYGWAYSTDEPVSPPSWEITDPETVAKLQELFNEETINYDVIGGWRTVPTYYVDMHNGLIFGVLHADQLPCAQIAGGMFVREDGTIGLTNTDHTQYGITQEAYDYLFALMRELDTAYWADK